MCLPHEANLKDDKIWHEFKLCIRKVLELKRQLEESEEEIGQLKDIFSKNSNNTGTREGIKQDIASLDNHATH